MTPQEIQLIKNCQAGKTEDFGRLYDMYIRKIYDFVYFKTHHKETAEDLTSQTFFKALNKIKNFDTSKGTFQAWVYQIARNTVIDHYRQQKADINIDDAWDIGTEEDIDRDLDNKKFLEQVRKYLSKLSSDQRDIVVMRLWQDMGYQEIAAALGKTEAACKMSFSRTIQKLRAEQMALLLLFLSTYVK